MVVFVSARLQELIKLRNLEPKHEPMKSLLLDMDLRFVSFLLYFYITD